MTDVSGMGMGTLAIHGGNCKNAFGALTAPIFQTSTFVFDNAEQGGKRFAGQEDGYIYSRLGNPTVALAEAKVALLEGGEAAMGASAGMGAISAALWTALKAGDHVISDKTLYGCTFAMMEHGLTRFGVEVSFVDTSNPDEVKKAMKPNTRVVYLETPANPNLKIADIAAVAKIAHSNPNTLVFVDNTFASPYCQKPLSLGADVVLHSATKYINGHGDVIAGFVVGKKDFVSQVRMFGQKDMTGCVLGPQEAFLICRGLKTFEVRMERVCKSAMEIARWLEKHPKIEKVYFPGLESHTGHDIAKRQMKHFGAMMSFELKSSNALEAGKTLLNSLHVCTLAVSLGDAETLIEHPASMTHSTYTREERLASGISDGLVRLSVGLENVEDIIADLEQGLKKI